MSNRTSCDLWIPHPDADPAAPGSAGLIKQNWLAIQQWSQRLIRECMPAGGVAAHGSAWWESDDPAGAATTDGTLYPIRDLAGTWTDDIMEGGFTFDAVDEGLIVPFPGLYGITLYTAWDEDVGSTRFAQCGDLSIYDSRMVGVATAAGINDHLLTGMTYVDELHTIQASVKSNGSAGATGHLLAVEIKAFLISTAVPAGWSFGAVWTYM